MVIGESGRVYMVFEEGSEEDQYSMSLTQENMDCGQVDEFGSIADFWNLKAL